MQIAVRKAGGMIHGIQFCPHHPDAGCYCRKPAPGMLKKAAVKYGIDLSRSYFVGDSAKDILAGHAVDCTTILVQSGTNPDKVSEQLRQSGTTPSFVAPGLWEAVDIILRHGFRGT